MRINKSLQAIESRLAPGLVYRRSELVNLSSNIDRNIASLVKNGKLVRLQKGLFACPEKTAFGEAPPNENELLKAFLKKDKFLVYSQNQFNMLGLGSTQLYNKRIVFNRKRHGVFNLGGKTYNFFRWREVPSKLTKEFLLVELVNKLNELAEDRKKIEASIALNLNSFEIKYLKRAVKKYGTYSTQIFFNVIFNANMTKHANTIST